MNAILLMILAAPPAQALLEAHGWGRPQTDPQLEAAAMDVARTVDLSGGRIAGEQLRFLLSRHRVLDAQVIPFTVLHAPGADVAPLLTPVLRPLERRFPPTHLGVATVTRRQGEVTAVLLVHRGVSLVDPPPHRAEPGQTWTLRGRLRPGYFRPRLLVAQPAPHPVLERPAWTREGGVEVTVYFDAGPGMYGLELVAESQYGPVVLTNHQVPVGLDPPEHPVVRLGPERTRGAPSFVLASWINQLRKDYRMAPVRVHGALETVARAHAAELARRDALIHRSPDSGTLATRLKASGVQALASAENLARAKDVRGAMRAFLDSPGHRRNLLLAPMTHVGIGVVGEYHAVVFARLPTRRRPAAGSSGSR